MLLSTGALVLLPSSKTISYEERPLIAVLQSTRQLGR